MMFINKPKRFDLITKKSKEKITNMDKFNKIVIDCDVNDLLLKDGKNISASNASYYIKEDCLYIELNDDSEIEVPSQHYEDISITSSCGDVEVSFKEASINVLSFRSDCGDLLLDALTDNVSFSSPGGDYIRKRGSPNKQIVNPKRALKVKDTTNNNPPINTKPSYKDGERYE